MVILLVASGALALHCSPANNTTDANGADVVTGGDTGGGGDTGNMVDAAPTDTGVPADTGMPRTCNDPGFPAIHEPCWRREPTGDLPNFTVRANVIAPSIQIRMENFTPTSCAVVDRCVAAPGMRRVMRFSFWVHNDGPADFYLGPPTGRNAIPDLFTQNSCNRVYELTGWGEYDLINADTMECAGYGHKQSFCLMDLARGTGGTTIPAAMQYNCNNQGIHAGYIDIYDRSLPCQFLDITDVAAGNYILRARVNTEHRVCETDYTDNSAEVMVTIP